MGNLLSYVWGRYFQTDREFKMLILGLANAGKTTLLYQLRLGQVIQTQPTIGSNVEEISYKNIKLQGWDLGAMKDNANNEVRRASDRFGLRISRRLITDKSNKLLSKAELFNLLGNELLKDAAFLVFANKQDLTEAMPMNEIVEFLGLSEVREHNYHIQPCSALKGEGINEGLDWLYEKIMEKNA